MIPALVLLLQSVIPGVPCTPVTPERHCVDLTWTASTSPVRAYRIFRSIDGVNFRQIAAGIKATEFGDLGVYNGKTYTYYVVAIGTNGIWSAPSEPAQVVIPE